MKNYLSIAITVLLLTSLSCQQQQNEEINLPIPTEIIDLGVLVTEDLPYKLWGKELMDASGYEKGNHFDVREWGESGSVSGSNAYYTIFNHAGPHIDAPAHLDLGGGINSYKIEQFVAPLKVFDVSDFPKGRTAPLEVFEGKVEEGDVVLIYTNYIPIKSEKFPPVITLSFEAAEYLAKLPVCAFATDAITVDEIGTPLPEAKNVTQRIGPIHYAFLSRSIPIYEGLANVDRLFTKENMLFVGAPLNIEDGDGMNVRPVALVYNK
ncbi:cyclase family protein [Maribellus mangrovi]|uniref:cyclase family protein n=1 Tax=Maribellus mangrovi TaxID=3133146 RepID=UPI0030EDCBA0